MVSCCSCHERVLLLSQGRLALTLSRLRPAVEADNTLDARETEKGPLPELIRDMLIEWENA